VPELGPLLEEKLCKISFRKQYFFTDGFYMQRESADLIQKAYQQNSKDFEILLILAKNYD